MHAASGSAVDPHNQEFCAQRMLSYRMTLHGIYETTAGKRMPYQLNYLISQWDVYEKSREREDGRRLINPADAHNSIHFRTCIVAAAISTSLLVFQVAALSRSGL